MLRVFAGFTVVVSLFLGPSALADEAKDDAEKKPKMSAEEVQKKVREAINSSGPAIDGCIEKYLKGRPDEKGEAKIDATINGKGQVTEATVKTRLSGARHLRACLAKVARGWRFPAPASDKESLALKVPVVKGVKFRIPAPGEKPKKKKAEKPNGFIRFAPKGWTGGQSSK